MHSNETTGCRGINALLSSNNSTVEKHETLTESFFPLLHRAANKRVVRAPEVTQSRLSSPKTTLQMTFFWDVTADNARECGVCALAGSFREEVRLEWLDEA
jgi:hypothetical protein